MDYSGGGGGGGGRGRGKGYVAPLSNHWGPPPSSYAYDIETILLSMSTRKPGYYKSCSSLKKWQKDRAMYPYTFKSLDVQQKKKKKNPTNTKKGRSRLYANTLVHVEFLSV